MVKNLSAVQDTWVQSFDREDPLEKEMATHSSILAWRIPRRSLAGYSPWGNKEEDTTQLLTVPLRTIMDRAEHKVGAKSNLNWKREESKI